jgi:methylthioribose-1-phosphate isomerase
MVIVGTDRTTAQGDVCNKIGTYLKALAAQRQRRAVLCRAAVADASTGRSPTAREIPIEERSATRSRWSGARLRRRLVQVRVSPEATAAGNPAFDVTPARLVTGLITERGIAEASREGLRKLFPERAR